MSDPYPDDWEARRRAVLYRSDYCCDDCGVDADDDVLHVHHIKPISNGGGHELENLKTLCPDCHADEHDKQRCNICHKIGTHWVDESKTSGTVGLSMMCRDHYRLIAQRCGKEQHNDNGSFGNPVAGFCVLCGNECTGKYALHDHGTRPQNATINSLMCAKCRRLYVFERRGDTRSELQRRVENYQVADGDD